MATTIPPPQGPANWWAMHTDQAARTSDARLELDFESEAFRRDEAAGLLKRFSHHGVRAFMAPIGGSGVADVVRFGNGVEVNVINLVLPTLRRRSYIADEAMILLRASLSCDAVFKAAHTAPVVFNRPELTLVCVPSGMHITAGSPRHNRQETLRWSAEDRKSKARIEELERTVKALLSANADLQNRLFAAENLPLPTTESCSLADEREVDPV